MSEGGCYPLPQPPSAPAASGLMRLHSPGCRSRRSADLGPRVERPYLENPSVHFGGSTATQENYASKFGKYGRCAAALTG